MSSVEDRAVVVEDQTEMVVPPVGEEIHLPGPSILPLTTAVGITLSIIGLTISYTWTIIGLITFFVSVGLWIRDVRRDVDELPDEHH